MWKQTEEQVNAPWTIAPNSVRDGNGDTVARHSARARGMTATLTKSDAFPLRVLHVLNRLDTGGTENVVLNLVQSLNPDLFEQRLCVTRGLNPEFLRTKELSHEPYVIGQANGGSQFLLFRLARIMRSYRPHIVHSRNWGAIEAVLAARAARVPIAIHSEHGYEVDMTAGLPKRRRLFRRGVYPMTDVVFTVSEELRSYHARQAWLAPEKIRVVTNGVDTTRFCPCATARAVTRERHGFSADCFVVGSVGRIVAIKDYPTLLKAAEIMVARGVNIRVLLAGSGPELENYRAAVARSSRLADRVFFLGATQNVPDVMNAMDAFVLPSLLEGMSNTILEAMACGLPVVATSVGGNPELVEDGVSGWLFEAGNFSDLVARIEQLAGSALLRNKFGTAARERVVNRFSLDRMISNYQDLYLELAVKRELVKPQDL